MREIVIWAIAVIMGWAFATAVISWGNDQIRAKTPPMEIDL